MTKVNDDSMLFPQKLMEILAEPENQKAISWLPSGKAFVIHDRDVFVESVMPKYFSRQAKYSSFTRKLNRWNFQRVSKGPESGAYFHQFFLREKPHLAAQMFCKNARTILAMASNEKKSSNEDATDVEPPRPSEFNSSAPEHHYLETAMNLPVSASLNNFYFNNNVNSSQGSVFGFNDTPSRLNFLDRSLMLPHYQDQHQNITNFGLLEDTMLRICNDRNAALNMQHQQSAAAALQADYFSQIQMQGMAEILQKQDEAVFQLGNALLPSPPKNSSGNSPPSGMKRASAA